MAFTDSQFNSIKSQYAKLNSSQKQQFVKKYGQSEQFQSFLGQAKQQSTPTTKIGTAQSVQKPTLAKQPEVRVGLQSPITKVAQIKSQEQLSPPPKIIPQVQQPQPTNERRLFDNQKTNILDQVKKAKLSGMSTEQLKQQFGGKVDTLKQAQQKIQQPITGNPIGKIQTTQGQQQRQQDAQKLQKAQDILLKQVQQDKQNGATPEQLQAKYGTQFEALRTQRNQKNIPSTAQGERKFEGITAIDQDIPMTLDDFDESHPVWNNFGQSASDLGNTYPGFQEKRNTMIAGQISMKLPNSGFISDADLETKISEDIVSRDQDAFKKEVASGDFERTIDRIREQVRQQIPQVTSDEMFEMIANGAEVPGDAQGNPYFQSAKKRYDKMNVLSTLGPADLATAISEGALGVGGKTRNDLINYKGMTNQLEQAREIYQYEKSLNISTYLMDMEVDTTKSVASQESDLLTTRNGELDISKAIVNTFGEGVGPFSSYLNQNPQVQEQQKSANATREELDAKYKALKDLKDDVKADLVARGGSAEGPLVNNYITNASKGLRDEIEGLQMKYDAEIATLGDLTDTAKMDYQYAQYQQGQKEKMLSMLMDQQKQAEDRAFKQQQYGLQVAQFENQIANQQFTQGLQSAQFGLQQQQQQFNQGLQTQQQALKQQEFNVEQAGKSTASGSFSGGVGNGLAGLGGVRGNKVTNQASLGNDSDLDIDVNRFDEITAPVGGTIIKLNTNTPGTKDGNIQMQIKAEDGKIVTINHLDPSTVEKYGSLVGQKIQRGQAIAVGGNSGNVMSGGKRLRKDGKVYDQSALDGNGGPGTDGSHIDVRVMGIKSGIDVQKYFNSIEGKETPPSISDIYMFNDKVTRRDMSKAEIERIGTEKSKMMSDPNAKIEDILNRSSGGKEVGATQSTSLEKFASALSQVGAISDQIKNMDTGPIIGTLSGLNPWNTQAQTLKAKLQGLVPTIARGVYGEVGVLTDNDVRLYAQTLPNLKGTEDINKGVLAYTLDILAGGYKNKLRNLAGQGYDVSGLEGVYMDIKSQADVIRNELGIPLSGQGQPQQTSYISGGQFGGAQAQAGMPQQKQQPQTPTTGLPGTPPEFDISAFLLPG